MLCLIRLLLAKASPSRSMKMAQKGLKDEGKEGKLKTRVAKVEAAIAASHFRSLDTFKLQAKAIDNLTLGRTRALKLMLGVLKKDQRTALNEGVTYSQVQLLDHRSGHLTSGLLPRSDCLHMARDAHADLIEIGKSLERVSFCMVAHYRALVLADIEAHLFKEQLKAENIYSKGRKILPICSTVQEAEVRQKAAQVVHFLTSRYGVTLQLIHIPPAWKVPLYDTALRADEDDGLAVQPVSKVFRGHRALRDPHSVAAYKAMESIETEIRALVTEELKDHPKNPRGLTLTANTVLSSFLHKPLLLMEYSLAADVKTKKKRVKK
eukprot:GGOE01054549.1.p1 GENE.GGOE01054549.1~~GGOE01054549.1.p1  ORF type:complete len:322 (-),score=95.26 GGOE01054549.1:218-1183(-)